MGYAESNREGQAFVAAFRQGLQELGWFENRNLRIDTRWAISDDADSIQQYAKELFALEPDLILSNKTPTTAAMLRMLLNGDFTFCPIRRFNGLAGKRQHSRQLLRDRLHDEALAHSIERLDP
jgi:hypothetical protein